MATAILSSKGQIVIPREVRERLGIGVGDRVQFIEDAGGSFRIVPATSDIRELKGVVAKPKAAVSIEGMKNAIARRAARSAGGKR